MIRTGLLKDNSDNKIDNELGRWEEEKQRG